MFQSAKPYALVLAFCFCLLWLAPVSSQAAGRFQYLAQPASSALPPYIPSAASFKGAGNGPAAWSSAHGFNLSAAYDQRLLPWLRGEVESGWLRMSDQKLKPASLDIELDSQDADPNLYGMLNLLADFNNASQVTPFVGLGLGVARPALDGAQAGASGGADIALGFQAVAGVMWKAAPHFGLEFRGRYLGGGQDGLDAGAASAPAVLDLDGGSAWAMDVGVRFSF